MPAITDFTCQAIMGNFAVCLNECLERDGSVDIICEMSSPKLCVIMNNKYFRDDISRSFI